jgi:hypothetical protein
LRVDGGEESQWDGVFGADLSDFCGCGAGEGEPKSYQGPRTTEEAEELCKAKKSTEPTKEAADLREST